MSIGILESHLPNVVNSDISLKYYSGNAKTATVRQIFKKDDRTQDKNYRSLN